MSDLPDPALTKGDYFQLWREAMWIAQRFQKEAQEARDMFVRAVAAVGRIEIPRTLLIDDPRGTVERHDPVDRNVIVFKYREDVHAGPS